MQFRITALENKSKIDQGRRRIFLLLNQKTSSVEFNINEEEVAREEGWIRDKSKKNKKVKLNTFLSTSQQKLTFEQSQNKAVENKKPPPPLPPIIIENVESYQALYKTMISLSGSGVFNLKLMNGKAFKINATGYNNML